MPTRTRRAYSFEQKRNFGCNTDEVLVPEIVLRVAEKFYESDQCAPRVRAVHQETFQEDFSHDFPEAIILDLNKQIEHQGTEPMRVSIGVPQVQHHSAQEVMLT